MEVKSSQMNALNLSKGVFRKKSSASKQKISYPSHPLRGIKFIELLQSTDTGNTVVRVDFHD